MKNLILAVLFLALAIAPRLQGQPSAGVENFSWELVARMPVVNHDIAGAELDGRFYVAGGRAVPTGEKQLRIFDEIWELTPWKWRVAAKLSARRFYCATAVFGNKVWVLGGEIPDGEKTSHPVTLVECYDPKTGLVAKGPDSLAPRLTPVALVSGGRLYVMGSETLKSKTAGRMESIGAGETIWRREPDGPPGMAPIVGVALDDRLYVNLPNQSLAVYDTREQTWSIVEPPLRTRSCQMAAYRGEIWMMGGRGAKEGRETMILTPATQTWRPGPPLPEDLSWGAAGVIGDDLFITGGANVRGFSDATYRLLGVAR